MSTALSALRRGLRAATPALALGTAALTAVLAACSDSPTAPATSAPHATIASTTAATLTTVATAVNAVTWKTPVTQLTVSAVIGTGGGTLSIPNGITLAVPQGAVTANTTFSITRLPGKIVAYDFQPHGTFAKPLTISHPTANTIVPSLLSLANIQGAYFADPTLMDQTVGTAQVNEFEPTSMSVDKGTVVFTVTHFSGYLVSTGRH